MIRLLCCLLLLCCTSVAQASTLAHFRTYFGVMEVELYDHHKPITVNNFIRYVQSGFYEDGFIHRCDPNFVIQGGGFFVAQDVIWGVPTFPPIRNEFGDGAMYSNVYGTIAMAKLPGGIL